MASGSPLIGRSAELRVIRRAAQSARRGRGRFLLVAGEAGAGKTFLVRQALGTSAPTLMYAAPPMDADAVDAADDSDAAYDPDAAYRFGPIVAAIRSHPGWPAAGRRWLDGGWLPFLKPLLPEIDPDEPLRVAPESSQGDAARTGGSRIAAFRNLILALARDRPAALVVDDLQRADDATLAVLRELAATVEREPLLVVAAYRSGELHRRAVREALAEIARLAGCVEIDLEGLSEQAVADLASRRLDGRPDEELIRWLMEKTGGLPLFVDELTTALKADGALSRGDHDIELRRDDVRLPASLREAVLARLEGLPSRVRDALAIAALVGDPVPIDLVDRAWAGLGLGPETSGWAAAGLDRGVLREPEAGLVSFRHGLVRDVLVAGPSGASARAAHKEIAAALVERGSKPLVIAEHFLAANEPSAAIAALIEAADASTRVHAYSEAAATLRRALAVNPAERDVELDLVERLAECLELSGDLTEAIALLERASVDRAAGSDWQRAADDGRRCATLLELRGQWERAIELRRMTAEWLSRAGNAGDAAVERLAAAAHLRSAAAFTAARELLATALAEARAAGRIDLEARIVGLDGNVLARMGRAEDGLERVRRGLELALDGGLAAPAAELYQRLADSLEHSGDYGAARQTYVEGADYCRRQSIEPAAQLCLACLSVVLFQTGDWATAERTCREVIASGRGTPHALAVAEGTLGLVAVLKGSAKRARPHLLAALTLARHIELAAMELISLAGLARCDAIEGEFGAASDRCRDLLRRWEVTEERHYSVSLLRWAATFFASQGDATGTRECAAALGRIASETGQPDAVAALGVALGEAAMLTGDAAAAADHFVAAVELVAARTLPVERTEIGWRAGIALVQAGRRREAVSALVDAHRTARRLGAAPLARRIAGDLQSLGEPIERRLGRREARRLETAGLTRRELEVLRLVAAGHSSRSIGEALFISPRTAEMHVASAVAKLDCKTRAEAAHRAASLGLFAPASPTGALPH